MTLNYYDRFEFIKRDDAASYYQINFSFSNSSYVEVSWGVDEDIQKFEVLKEGVDYTIDQTIDGGQLKLLVDPKSLVNTAGQPFLKLLVASVYPYKITSFLPVTYSGAAIDLMLTFFMVCIQQIESMLKYLLSVPGITLPKGIVVEPNDRNRIIKIANDEGRNIFGGCWVKEDDWGLDVERNFKVGGTAEITGALHAKSTAEITGAIYGRSTAEISISLTVPTIYATTLNVVNIFGSGNAEIDGTLEVRTKTITPVADIATLKSTTISPLVGNNLGITCSELIATLNVTTNILSVTSDATIGQTLTANRVIASTLLQSDGLLSLKNTVLSPSLGGSSVGEFLFLDTATDGARFKLTSKLLDIPIINIKMNWVPKGASGNDLIDSCIEEGTEEVVVHGHGLTIEDDTKYLSCGGLLDIGGTKIKLDLPPESLVNENVLTLVEATGETFEWYLRPVINVGGGGGTGNLNVNLGYYGVGDGAGGLVNGKIYQTDTYIQFLSSIYMYNGARILIDFQKNSIISGAPLVLKDPDDPTNVEYDYELVTDANAGGGGGGAAYYVTNDTIAKGYQGSLADSQIRETATEVIVNSTRRLRTKTLSLGESGREQILTSNYTNKQELALDIKLHWLRVGETAHLQVKKTEDGKCIILMDAPSPTFPSIDNDDVEDGIAVFKGHVTGEEREVYCAKNTLINDKTIAGMHYSEAEINLYSFAAVSDNLVGNTLNLSPSDTKVLIVPWSADITSIVINGPVQISNMNVVWLLPDTTGLKITLPGSWITAGNFNTIYSIKGVMVGLKYMKLSETTDNFFAAFLESNINPLGDINTIIVVPPYTLYGIALFIGAFGVRVYCANNAMVDGGTLSTWGFATAEINLISNETQEVTVGQDGSLNLNMTGPSNVFYFTHDVDITAINITIGSIRRQRSFVWTLYRRQGLSVQTEVPMPGGCLANNQTLEFKNGFSIVSGFWDGERMIVNDAESFDAGWS